MLLRRISQHVKDQNWFAVILDFIIVVAGVFLGIQIGNWNSDRAMHRQASVLEQQLEIEMAVEALNYRFVLIYYQDVQTNGEILLGDVVGNQVLADEDYVIKAFRATQYTGAVSSRYAFDQIVAASVASHIKNQDLWLAADFVYNVSWTEVAAEESMSSNFRRLFRETVPLDVQRDARLRCGDPNLLSLSLADSAVFYQPDYVVLDYPCTLSVTAERIALAAKVLREADGLAPALRFRIAELDNTNALIADINKQMEPWRMTAEEFTKATGVEQTE